MLAPALRRQTIPVAGKQTENPNKRTSLAVKQSSSHSQYRCTLHGISCVCLLFLLSHLAALDNNEVKSCSLTSSTFTHHIHNTQYTHAVCMDECRGQFTRFAWFCLFNFAVEYFNQKCGVWMMGSERESTAEKKTQYNFHNRQAPNLITALRNK